MNPYAIEQKKENSLFGYSCHLCWRRLLMGPLGGDLGYFPVSSLFCCVQHNLHTSFVYSLRQLLVLPCAFTAIYILRMIALCFVTEMSQIH